MVNFFFNRLKRVFLLLVCGNEDMKITLYRIQCKPKKTIHTNPDTHITLDFVLEPKGRTQNVVFFKHVFTYNYK